MQQSKPDENLIILNKPLPWPIEKEEAIMDLIILVIITYMLHWYPGYESTEVK